MCVCVALPLICCSLSVFVTSIHQLDAEGGRRLAEEMGHAIPKRRRGCGERIYDLHVGAGQETAGEYPDHCMSPTRSPPRVLTRR